MKSLEDRFWSKVDRRGPDDCWEWQGARAGLAPGYGTLWIADGVVPGAPSGTGRKPGRMHPATRICRYLTTGEWPAGDMDVCHTCDNPPCVNPAHLWLGTTLENIQDCVRKGRARGGGMRGERNPMAKVSDDQVREILARTASGERHSDIAADYGISHTMVYRYSVGELRKDVTAA